MRLVIATPLGLWALLMLAVLATGAGCGGSGADAAADGQAGATVEKGNLRFTQGYTAGYEEANRVGRPMMVFFTAPWCDNCKTLEEKAFTHPDVVALAGEFTCVVVDADAEPNVCEHFRIASLPTVQFFAPTGEALHRVVGWTDGPAFASQMKAALQPLAFNAPPLRPVYR